MLIYNSVLSFCQRLCKWPYLLVDFNRPFFQMSQIQMTKILLLRLLYITEFCSELFSRVMPISKLFSKPVTYFEDWNALLKEQRTYFVKKTLQEYHYDTRMIIKSDIYCLVNSSFLLFYKWVTISSFFKLQTRIHIMCGDGGGGVCVRAER